MAKLDTLFKSQLFFYGLSSNKSVAGTVSDQQADSVMGSPGC